MNENENTTTQNLWDTVKALLRERFIAIQAQLKKQGKSQINNLTLHLKQLEKRNEEPQGKQKKRNLKNQGRNKCKTNKTDDIKNQQRQSWFFEKINKIYK